MRIRLKTLQFFLVTALVSLAAIAFAAPMPDTFADLVAKVKPSVVNISSVKVVKGHGGMAPGPNEEAMREFFGDEFFKKFFGDKGKPGQPGQEREFRAPSLGSGFVWDSEGYIVTNYHVINETSDVKVILDGGKEFDAKVIGGDQDTDVALLKIEPGDTKLSPVRRGNSDSIRVGDWVIAIGNPFGFGHTVTAGILSAKERVIGSGPYDDFLQTDAAINPGNSGGPLFDINGGVVGINSAKIDGASSIGFAIPINMAAEVINQLKENNGVVSRAWLGVSIQEVTGDIAGSIGLGDRKGALVGTVFEGGPAEKAGIKRGDVIVAFDGKPVQKSSQLPYMVGSHKPDSTVDVEVFRKGEIKKVKVKLGTRDPKKMAPAEGSGAKLLGIAVDEITPDLKKALNLKSASGVVVTEVLPKSQAAKAGLKRGDVIIEVNREEITDIASYEKAMEGAENRESVLFAIERGQNTSYLVVRVKDK